MMGLFVYGVLYLLQSLDVLKKQNPLVFKIQTALFALYEPVLSPIRQLIPVRVDLSMITLYLILYFVREVIRKIVAYFPL